MADPDALPDDVDRLRAALAAEQQLRREAEARASGAEAMVAHLKLLIARLRQDRFGASSERGRKLLDQMELELEELEAAAAEDASVAANDATVVQPFTRRKPAGHMGGASSLNWPSWRRPRLPSMRCGGSMRSSISSAASTACLPRSVSPYVSSMSLRW
jgi:hypothetical protein